MRALERLIDYNKPALREPAKLPNFDRLARVYRWLEWLTFGPWLWKCRCAFLPQLRGAHPRRALVIGDGDGRFTARLLAENRRVNVEAVDVSHAMLAQLARNSQRYANRIRMHCADARVWNPVSERYDLIVTHFFLDCLTDSEVAELAIRLRRFVTPETQWVISEFAVPQNQFGRLVARPLITGLYLAFRILTGLKVRRLPDHSRALINAGFTRVCERQSLCGLLTSELWKPDPELSKLHCAD
jgi:SAM-dependent methyltransferase